MAKRRTKILFSALALVIAVLAWQSQSSSQRKNVTPIISQSDPQVAQIDPKQEEAERREKDERDKKYSALAAAKAAVLKKLTDPDSAKFGKIVYRPSGVVCGFVNAKNVMGGYAGETAFISLGTADLTWMRGQSKDFDNIWNKRCANS